MRIVVTGGAGYVGSVITKHLLEAGHSVIVTDNLSHGHQNSIPKEAFFLAADIADLAAVLQPSDNIDVHHI